LQTTIAWAGSEPAPTTNRCGLPENVRQRNSACHINEHRQMPGAPVWQRNCYKQIVCDEQSLDRLRRCIAENPKQWHLDMDNPDVTAVDPVQRVIFG
jgi:hypothetical protein